MRALTLLFFFDSIFFPRKQTIWDTAGQERFRTLTSSYYRGAQGIILTYDVTRRETFEALPTWLQEVEEYSSNGGADVIKLLVGNKVDREDDRQVSRSEAVSWARSKGMMMLECSAKTSAGIEQVFTEICQKALDNEAIASRCGRGTAREKGGLGGMDRGDMDDDDLGCC